MTEAFPHLEPLSRGFTLPADDLCRLLERLGVKMFTRERTLAQYVSWSVQNGLFEFIASRGSATIEDIAANTPLSEAGADSLLGVMCALEVVIRDARAGYALCPLGRDYLLEGSPFYVGSQIAATAKGLPIPRPYLKGKLTLGARLKLWALKFSPSLRYGSTTRLENQHARNLGACAAAVRTGEFAKVRCIVDIAGGTGTFAIPCALEHTDCRVILTDLPDAIDNARGLIDQHSLPGRIELLGLDAFALPWRIPACDGIFIGNFLHGFGDQICQQVCREGYERLDPGGRLWLHEMVWNENRDGPLMTALWHAALRSAGPGRKRTASELARFLEGAGFTDIRMTRTMGAFLLVSGRKATALGSMR